MVRLLLLAITVVPIRFGLLFLSDYAGTLAMLEALTRLRHAIYHHTLCLGTLAFRTVNTTEAVSVSSRLEAIGEHRILVNRCDIY